MPSFVAARPADTRGEGKPAASPQLQPLRGSGADGWRAAHERGRKTWELVDISYDDFAAHVAAMGHEEPPSHAAELYLTVACRLGQCAAIQVLEDEYISRTRSAIQTIVRDSWVVDDVLQEVRRRLFVGPAARVACYRGTGPLGSWIRAIALNVARDHLRTEGARRRREESQACALLCGAGALPLQDDDIARCILRKGRAQACLEAVQRAFQALPQRERALLHDHYFHGLSIDALAPLYVMNRATAARHIRRSTQELGRQVRRQLAVLYPREDPRTLGSLALAACRHLVGDTALLLGVRAADSGSARSGLRQPSDDRTDR